jgi:hypothetical protein
MSPDDVPRIPEYPIYRVGTQPPYLPARWTMQYFTDHYTVDHIRDVLRIHHNADIWAPDDLTEWPADFFFDMLYGCVALHTWGSKEGYLAIRRMVPEECLTCPRDLYLDPEGAHNGGEIEQMDVEMDQVESERETDSATRDPLGNVVDGLMNLWQGLDLQRGPEGLNPHSGCPQEVQEKVSNWLGTQ